MPGNGACVPISGIQCANRSGARPGAGPARRKHIPKYPIPPTSFRQERKLFLPEKRKSKMRKRITLSLLVLVLCFSSVLTSCGMLAFIDKSVIEQNDNPSSVSAFESESDPIPDDKKLAPSGSGDVSEPLFWKVSGNGYRREFLSARLHSRRACGYESLPRRNLRRI